MNATQSTTDYAAQVSSVLHRHVANLRTAIDDGGWGASEVASIDLWLRAELMPWARDKIGELPEPRVAGHLLRDLAVLDTELLGTAGHDALRTAQQVEVAVRRLIYAISTIDSRIHL